MTDENKIRKVLNVIDNFKLENEWGHKCKSGYHSIVLGDKSFKGQRDNAKRLSFVGDSFNFNGKVVLDIGCNAGGMIHELSPQIKKGIGLDLNPKNINICNIIKEYKGLDNTSFYTFDLDKEDINFMSNFILEDVVDICLFLSVAMHIKKWQEVIDFCYSISDNMLFESNGRGRCQSNQISYIKKVYPNVKFLSKSLDDDRNNRRHLFFCSKM